MIMRLAREHQKPVYIHAVGVSNADHFSELAESL